jgi:peptidoglycan hydrolase-like protein with peptidoglycan-binding domain
MRRVSFSILSSVVILATAIPAFGYPHSHRSPTSPKAFRGKSSAKASPRAAAVARPGISSERATQIQSALIKQGYLSGEPTGTWDKESQAAMEKMQSDNGWQTKLVPDSRAIIKLGLGPTASASGEANALESAAPGNGSGQTNQ